MIVHRRTYEKGNVYSRTENILKLIFGFQIYIPVENGDEVGGKGSKNRGTEAPPAVLMVVTGQQRCIVLTDVQRRQKTLQRYCVTEVEDAFWFFPIASRFEIPMYQNR